MFRIHILPVYYFVRREFLLLSRIFQLQLSTRVCSSNACYPAEKGFGYFRYWPARSFICWYFRCGWRRLLIGKEEVSIFSTLRFRTQFSRNLFSLPLILQTSFATSARLSDATIYRCQPRHHFANYCKSIYFGAIKMGVSHPVNRFMRSNFTWLTAVNPDSCLSFCARLPISF